MNQPTENNTSISDTNLPSAISGTQSSENNNLPAETNVNNTDENKQKIKDKIWYSIDFGLFVSGIILLLLCDFHGNQTEGRSIISGLFIATSYFMFPFIEYKKKEKAIRLIAIHLLLTLIILLIIYFSLLFYKNHLSGGGTGFELLAALGLLITVSYVGYVFISILKIAIEMIKKIKIYLFNDSVQSGYSAAKKIIEGVTAFIVAVTAMIASIAALIAAAQSIIPK